METKRTLRSGLAVAAAIAAGILASACGQDGVTLPDFGSGGAGCGDFYPGSGEADAGVDYGPFVGKTLDCFSWTSVRMGPGDPSITDPAVYANTYLSVPEIFLKAQDEAMKPYLEAQFGLSEVKVLLFAIASTSCGTCPDLIEAVTNSKAEMLEDGVLPVGVLSYDLNDASMTEAWDLIAADNQLLLDGIDPSIYRTNDPEHYLGLRSDFDGFPYIIAVRVSDMKVAVKDYGTAWVNYGAENTFMVDALVAAVEAAPAD